MKKKEKNLLIQKLFRNDENARVLPKACIKYLTWTDIMSGKVLACIVRRHFRVIHVIPAANTDYKLIRLCNFVISSTASSFVISSTILFKNSTDLSRNDLCTRNVQRLMAPTSLRSADRRVGVRHVHFVQFSWNP